MNRIHLATSIALCFLMIFFSCQKSITPIETEQFANVKPCTSNTLKISKESISLTKDDATNVALMFSSSGLPETRGGVDKTVLSVIPVKENGETLLYGVNFEDGYLLISGTKHYYPILAEVKHGIFNGTTTGTGADILLSEIKDHIKAANANPELRVSRSVWRQYEDLVIPEIIPPTRNGLDDELYDLMYGLGADGWTVYSLANQPENMPDDLYEEFCDAAYNENGEDPNYDYRYYCFIAEKSFENQTSFRAPLLSTAWTQGYPYNNADLFVPLGCVTIAMAQILRYHEYPEYCSSIGQGYFPYDLSSLPFSITTCFTEDEESLCDMLLFLKNELYENGTPNIQTAKNQFEDFGYSCSLINHRVDSVKANLNRSLPVYMRGYDVNHSTGHAWVCDGYRTIVPYDRYRLYVFRYDGGVPSYYDVELDEVANQSGPITLLAMNWGFGGSDDGYYVDGNVISVQGGEVLNPSSSRYDLLISW